MLEDYLPKVAAPLLAPGHARDLDETRRVVPEALAEVARLLRQQKLSVEATETSHQLPNALLPKIGIMGFLDLVAEGRAGKLVIDFKWQQSDKGRREEIRQGRAIQLAVYRALMSQSKQSVSAGYYLLRQRQFLQPEADAFGTGTGLPGKSLEDTWTDICDSARQVAGELKSGDVRAPGHLKKKERQTLAITVPVLCKYCDFQALCGAEGDPS